MAPARQDRRGDSSSGSRRLWRLSGMGMELASHIAAGVLLGWLIDRWTGMEPTWLVVGAIAGVVVGMVSFIRVALKANRDAVRNSKYVRRMPTAAADKNSATLPDGGNSEGDQND